METRECHICNIDKAISEYRGTDKRYHSYRYCSDCVDAELIKCTSCDIVQHKDMYNKSIGQYLDRKTKCTPCRTAAKTDADYAREKAWRSENKDKTDSYYKTQCDKYPGYFAAKSARKLKPESNVKCNEYMEFLMEEFYSIASERTKVTGIRHEVDHVIPREHDKVCGLHTPYNLQVITATENMSKSNNWSIEE